MELQEIQDDIEKETIDCILLLYNSISRYALSVLCMTLQRRRDLFIIKKDEYNINPVEEMKYTFPIFT